MPAPKLTTVICTHNRAELLDGVVRALVAQTLAADEHEVLIVDNASSDATSSITASLAALHRNVRQATEPTLGLSRARNTGLALANAPIVAFVDDDARPAPDWGQRVLQAFETYPAMVGLGGGVELRYGAEPPRWVTPSVEAFLGRPTLGGRARLLDEWETPFGVNMAVRRWAAERVGGFTDSLGRSGTHLLSGEEVLFFRRLRAEVGPLRWEPEASVVHLVDSDRLRLTWLWRRAVAQGTSEALMGCYAGPHAVAARRWPRSRLIAEVLFRRKGALLRARTTDQLIARFADEVIAAGFLTGVARARRLPIGVAD